MWPHYPKTLVVTENLKTIKAGVLKNTVEVELHFLIFTTPPVYKKIFGAWGWPKAGVTKILNTHALVKLLAM